ncbi:hypothetical protein HDV05_005497, partial [Chytridiales sp. JEL 0842]
MTTPDEPVIQKSFASVSIIPKSVHEALSGPDKDLWQAALTKELEALEANATWALTKLPPVRKAIPCQW